MKAIDIARVAVIALALQACGGGGGAATTGTQDPPATPIVTSVGGNVGEAVTQTIDAAGGTISAAGVTVSVPAGAFDSTANVTLQPLENTLALAASGQGIAMAVSADAAWKLPLTVTYPIKSADPDPTALVLATHLADGTWRSLPSPAIDTAAGTVSASLPPAGPTAAAAAGRAARQAAAAVTYRAEVSKLAADYLSPMHRRVKLSGTASFVPNQALLHTGTLPRPEVFVTGPHPIPNERAGFETTWLVDGVVGGTAASGTIKANGKTGATYTAPATDPGRKITVQFRSIRKPGTSDPGLDVVASATVIVGDGNLPQQYGGNVTVSGIDTDGNTFEASSSGVVLTKTYESPFAGMPLWVGGQWGGLATFRVTNTYVGCDPVTVDMPMNLSISAIGKLWGPEIAYVGWTKYWLAGTMETAVLRTINCSGEARTVLVVAAFQTGCDLLPPPPESNLRDWQDSYDDALVLSGNKTLTCHNGLPETTLTMHWTLYDPHGPPK